MDLGFFGSGMDVIMEAALTVFFVCIYIFICICICIHDDLFDGYFIHIHTIISEQHINTVNV